MMKKFCFLLLICTLLLSAGCQKDGNQPVGQALQTEDKTATAVNNEKDNGQPTEPVDDGKVPVWHLEGQRPAEGSYYQTSYQYTYDESGNEIRRDIYSSGRLFGYYTFTYDQAGNETTRICYNSDGSEDWRYVYSYDANGNQTEWLSYEDGKMRDKSLYSYNENGDMTEYLYYSGEDDDDPSKETYKYLYLEDGRIAESTRYKGVHAYTTKYIYSDSGVLCQKELWNDGVCVTVYTYNEKGVLVKVWSNGGRSIVNYNEDGTLAEIRQEWIEDSKTVIKRRTFAYDSNGNMTERKFYTDDVLTEHYYYTYTQIRVLPEKVDTAIARQKELMEDYQ